MNAQIIKIQQTEEGAFLLLTKNKDLLVACPRESVKPEIRLLYNSQNKTGDSRLRNNILHETAESLNWIGMDFSILSCKKGDDFQKKTPLHITESLTKMSSSPLTSACVQKNELWLGSSAGTIFRVNLHNGNITEYRGIADKGEVQNIALDQKNGNLYVTVKQKGIYELNLNNKAATFITTTEYEITHSYVDYYGAIWFISNRNRLLCYTPQQRNVRFFRLAYNETVNESVIWQDGKELGMFFLSTAGEVFNIDHRKTELKALTPDINNETNRQTDNKFSNMLLKDDGILWLTTYNEGIFKAAFPKQQFQLFTPKTTLFPGLRSNNERRAIKALFREKNGDIWISSRESEVYRYDKNGRLKNHFSDQNYNIGNVYHIMQDRDGSLWFSTKGQGLVKATADSNSSTGFNFTRFTYNTDISASISSNDIYHTFQDRKGRIWVASFGGGINLLMEDERKIIFKHKYNSFSLYPEYGQYMEVRNILEDRTGRFWVATSDGLMSFDGNFSSSNDIRFETYKNESNIINNDIYGLYKDRNGDIWVSVFGGGWNKLAEYDNDKKTPLFESYGLREGINSDVILSAVEDGNGVFWLSTETGVSRFNPVTKTFFNFDKYDGLPTLSMEEESALLYNDSSLWFGSREGILEFDPGTVVPKTTDYPTYIVAINVLNKNFDEWNNDSISVKYIDEITLKHDESMFSIEFAALNYHNLNQVNYQYKLEGFQKEWHFNGKNRLASFTNVPPGKYVFKVRAIDEGNLSLVSETMLRIKIFPPWWKTTWAYAVYTILLILILFALMKFVAFAIKTKNDIYINQKISDLKITFFTNVSHELRTPLTLIKVPIQELKENENLSAKDREYVNMVENNTDHMLNLVNQILDFRKIESKKMRLHISRVNLNNLVKSVFREFALLAEENEISYNYHIPDENIVVWADKEKIETSVRNILSNAFKFTPQEGSIHVTVDKNYSEQRSYIRVEDTGMGIPQDKLKSVFERFSQADNNPTTNYQGTGIGLALTKELILMHHGNIHAESRPESGATFTIELLLGNAHLKESEIEFYVGDMGGTDSDESHPDEEPPTTEEYVPEEMPNLPTILLVEDNKELCNLLKLQLEDSYNVILAYNGATGLKKAHQHHPDIIISDQMMPNMSGLELLKEIRNDFMISHIPVIILTAKNDEETKIKSIQLGGNAYITKPFSKTHLIARIEQLLYERKLFREKLWIKDEKTTPQDSADKYLSEKDAEFLENIHQVIDENIDNSDFNINTIAQNLNLSRSSFFKKLKNITGLAPVDLVKEYRLNKSVELMKDSDMSVSEIAYSVGFKDLGYFGKCFKKKYDVSPREYINMLKK